MKRSALILMVMSLLHASTSALATEMIEIAPTEQIENKELVVITPDVIEKAIANSGAKLNDVGDENWVAVYLQIGNWMGIRARVFAWGTPQVKVAVDGFGGLAFTRVGAGNTFGAGIHSPIKVVGGEHNGLFITPGVDVYVMLGKPDEDPERQDVDFAPYTHIHFISTQAEVSYVLEIFNHWGFEIGVRGGVAWALNGTSMAQEPARGNQVYDLGVFTGFRF